MIKSLDHLKICYNLLDALKVLNKRNKIVSSDGSLFPVADAIIQQLSQATEIEFHLMSTGQTYATTGPTAGPHPNIKERKEANRQAVKNFISDVETLLPLICKRNEL